jgi:hypothetical protein
LAECEFAGERIHRGGRPRHWSNRPGQDNRIKSGRNRKDGKDAKENAEKRRRLKNRTSDSDLLLV